MKHLFQSLAAFVALILAVLGIGGVRDTNRFQNREWMADVADSALISEISIPGTHDSCALYEPIAPCAKCQNYSLKDQLDMGVRFIDIRGVVVGKRIQIVHGPIYQAQSLDDVYDTVCRFLDENPTETVIMSLKEDVRLSRNGFSSVVSRLLDRAPERWYTEDEIPALGDVRGKIVLFNRFDDTFDCGLQTSEWLKNQTFEIQKQTHTLHIQDYYKIESVEAAWAQAKALLDECRQLEAAQRSNHMYIHFLSGYLGAIPDPVTVAQGMNTYFTAYLSGAPKGCLGIVLFDFIEPEYCDALIASNFSAEH